MAGVSATIQVYDAAGTAVGDPVAVRLAVDDELRAADLASLTDGGLRPTHTLTCRATGHALAANRVARVTACDGHAAYVGRDFALLADLGVRQWLGVRWRTALIPQGGR